MRTIRQRRLKGKTDYKARFGFLKSEKPRFVVRKTNRYILVQLVQSDIAQDKVLFGISSKILLSKGWPEKLSGSLKSLSAAYLTGFHAANIALKQDVKEAIFDFGMHRNIHKSRIYSVIKGALDAGLKISCSEEVLPSDEEISKSDKLKPLIEKIKSNL